MGLAIVDSVIGLAAPLLDKFVVDKDKKAEFEHELKMVLHNANLQQNQIKPTLSLSKIYLIVSRLIVYVSRITSFTVIII